MPKFLRSRPFWLLLTLLVIIIAGIYTSNSDERKDRIRKDFTDYSLAASRAIYQGNNPYDRELIKHNYKYFPTNAILLRPFINMPFYSAQGTWFSINLALLVFSFMALRSLLQPLKIPWYVYALVIVATIRAINMNIRLGQWNTSVYCLSIIGVAFLAHAWRITGSIILGLAVTLKFMPGIFLIYFAIRRRWRDFTATLIASLFWMFLFPMVILGPTRGGQLLELFYHASTDRVPKITLARETSSVSMYSTIYRTLTPVPIELKGLYFTSNIANLSTKQAANLAGVFSVIFVIAMFTWMYRATRKVHINPVGELVLIGLTYLTWFIAAPGVRHAQLISIIPLIFGIVTAMVYAPTRKIRTILILGFLGATLTYVSTSEIVNETRYNLYLEANGIVSWALIAFAALGIWTYYRAGRIQLLPAGPNPQRQDAEDSQNHVG